MALGDIKHCPTCGAMMVSSGGSEPKYEYPNKIGDTMKQAPGLKVKRIRAAASNYGKKHNMKFSVAKGNPSHTITRIE